MKGYSYKVGELRAFIRESSQEFKPVLGPNVERDNKRNNSESYKESEKRAKDYNGGVSDKKDGKLQPKTDGNRTTIDYNPRIEPDERYKKRVNAQLKGYTSDIEEKNGNERGGVEMDKSGRIGKWLKDARSEREKQGKQLAKSGLAARELPDEMFDKNHLNENNNKEKCLRFKHTRFLNEAQVLDRVPEEYKRDGQRIRLIDKNGKEFVVECSLSNRSGRIETNIVGRSDKKEMNEQVDRIFSLMDYSSPSGMSVREKINEDTEFGRILGIVRENED